VRSSLFICCSALVALAPAPACAHLLVTEVGYDPVDETGATGEFVEILNPGPGPMSLANVWLANDEEAYPLLVNGPIASGITSGDFVYRFPAVTLEAGQVAVVCHDSDAFLAEHFAGGPVSFFAAQPGSPLLFEITADGDADGVPAMIPWGSNPAGTLSMANNGESVGIVAWDGVSDRVTDHDWVCWLTLTNIINKDVDYPFGIDGPDADLDGSFFLEDAGTALPAPDASEGQSIHRLSLSEPGETAGGGNGVSGHDESTEDASAWQVLPPTPGVAIPGVVGIAPGAAPPLALTGAFPNPCVADTRIGFSLPAAGHARLVVCDIAGRAVATLVDGAMAAGQHRVAWNAGARGARPGIYFARLEFKGRRATVRIALMR
jgi:hypothetical protein